MSGFIQFLEDFVYIGDVEGTRKAWRDEYARETGIFGWTAVHYACRCTNGDQEDLVRLLLSLGCDVEAEDSLKMRPIHLCAYYGLIGSMKALLEAGCILTCVNNDGETPLMLAESCKNEKAVILLRSAMHVGTLASLHTITIQGEMSEFKRFIKNFVRRGDVEGTRKAWREEYASETYLGLTALHWACMEPDGDREGLVRLLLSLGCDVEAEASDRWRPIHLCAYYGHIGPMKALLEAGCSLTCVKKYGLTPLMVAEKYKREESAVLLRSAMQIQRPSMTNYVKLDRLGKGAFGSVYYCHNPNMDMIFSIKEVPLSETLGDVENKDMEALDNEIQIYSKWNYHRRIVRYYGTTKHKGEMVIFMEYASNGSLRDALNKSGPFTLKSVAKYSKQILEGLEFLHEHNIIHRDIKAANILRDFKDDIKLADFGISKFVKSISGKSKDFTAAGTPHWMAPEVIKAEENKEYDYRADVWSLGATILEMLTGKPPFHDFGAFQAVFKIGNGAPVDPYFPPDLDQQTISFLKTIFVHDPSERADVKTLLESSFFQDS